MPFARRQDTTQNPIVTELVKRGYIVEIEKHPVDLRVRHPSWRPNIWVKGECKTPNRSSGAFKLRTDREGEQRQADYCAAHGVPYWLCADDAVNYLETRGLEFLTQGTGA